MIKYTPLNLLFTPNSPSQTALDTFIDHDFEINHSCGGMGSCGTCRIFVGKGLKDLNPKNSIEFEMAQDRGFAINERLSCQLNSNVDFEFVLPKDLKS